MSKYQYAQLLQMIQEIGESLEQQEPVCDFSDDETFFDAENYADIFEGRD